MATISKSSFNLFFLFLVITWIPLYYTLLHFDGKGRILLSLTFFAFFLQDGANFKKILLSSPAVFFSLWLLYVLVCSFIKGINFENITYFDQVCILLYPTTTLFVTAIEYVRSSRKVLEVLNFAFFIYALLGIYMLLDSDVSTSSGRLINVHLGNALPLNMVLLFFISCLRCIKKDIKLNIAIIYCSIAIMVIIVSATRKAFVSSLIILSFTFLAAFKRGKKLKRLEIVLFSLILIIICNFIINNSVLGQRLNTTTEVGANYNTSSYPILDYLGDRAYQYLLGFLLFLDSPLTGIGLLNYMNQALDSLRLHSEYMVQLTECGLIGCVLTLSFYVSMIKKISKNKKKIGKGVFLVLLSGIISVLFIDLSAWTYDNPIYFVIFGIVVGSFIKCKKKNKSLN